MRDVEESGAELMLQELQLDLHAFAQLQIKSAEGFVEQQDVRLEHHAARDGDALLLAPGQLRHLFSGDTWQADAIKNGGHLAADIGLAFTPAAQAIGDVLADIHHREQGQVLEHHLDAALVGRCRDDRGALDADVAAGRRLEAGYHAHQGRLAAARRAEDREE